MSDILRPGPLSSYDSKAAFYDALHRFRQDLVEVTGQDIETIHMQGAGETVERLGMGEHFIVHQVLDEESDHAGSFVAE